MKLAPLLAIGLLALGGLARAQGTDPNAPLVCEVARDPQWVSPTGVLHVLDRTTSQVLRWSLSTRVALTPITIIGGGAAFAYLSARDSLVIARTSPLRVSLRALKDLAPELPITGNPPPAGELCGLGATDGQVVLCVRQGRSISYLVYDGIGRPTGYPLSGGNVGELPDPNDPNDPNAPVMPVLPSWDTMAWDGETHTMYSVRTQGVLLGALRVSIADDGQLAELVEFAPPSDPNVPRAIEPLTLLPSGMTLLAPDGLTITTDPFAVGVAPEDASGGAFAVGNDVFNLSEVDDGCALRSDDKLRNDARVSLGPVQTVQRNGNTWLLEGTGLSAKLRRLRPGSGDLDGDRARDEIDVFPLDPVTAKDSDNDGVDDKADAAPADARDWRDSDGDKVADSKDLFPDDPTEWKDSDGDLVGDHADAFPCDPNESSDLDSDGTGDNSDFDKLNPLEQSDTDPENDIGDNADRDPPFGEPTEAFELTLRRGALLAGFVPHAVTTHPTLVLYDNNRFKICERIGDCLGGEDYVSGTFERRGRSNKALKVRFDVRSLSKLFLDFAFEGSLLVPRETPDPRASSPYFFVPKHVDSVGSGLLTKKGITLTLRARFSYKRDPFFSAGWKGAFVYRATGTPLAVPGE